MIKLPVVSWANETLSMHAELGPEALDKIVEYINNQKASSGKIAEFAAKIEEKPMSLMDVYEAAMKGENPFLKAVVDGFAAKDAEIAELKKRLDTATAQNIDLVRTNNHLSTKLEDLQDCEHSQSEDACGECIACRKVSFEDAINQRQNYRKIAVDAYNLLSHVQTQLLGLKTYDLNAFVNKNHGL